MKDRVVDFIERRFQQDCNWCTGNCYFFAVILKAAFPDGEIAYLPTYNHFVFMYNEQIYDWTGNVTDKYLTEEQLFYWEDYIVYEPLDARRVIRDCCV